MNRKAIARLIENVRMGLDTIRTHRIRSALVILGVLIGVSTLMAVVTIVRGFTIKMESDIKRGETASFRMMAVARWERSRASELNRRPQMTATDRMAVSELPEVRKVDYLVQRRGPPFIFQHRGQKTRPSSLIGSTEDFPSVIGFRVNRGRFFNEGEIRRDADVIVLGSGPADTLFPHGDPVGKRVRVLDAGEFTVIGTFQPRKTLFGSIAENYAVIPYTTMSRLFHEPRSRATVLVVQPEEDYTIEQAMDASRNVMRHRRRVAIGKPDNFDMVTEDQILQFTEQVTGPMAIVLVVLSSIALLVGGIGLMAIQLVSVTERTREIGIRKALGARRRDILWQFLIESGTLTGVGGILGVAAGLGLGALASMISGFPAAYSPIYVAIAVVFSCGIGIFFGLAPAVKAARLDPIEALRHE